MTNNSNNCDNNTLKTAFLLTKQAQDQRHGIVITLWLAGDQGPVKLRIENELAVFFVENEYAQAAESLLAKENIVLAKCQSLPLKTFNQQKVTGFYFKYMRELYQARDHLKQHLIKCYEDDFRPDERYLMERFITSAVTYVGNEVDKKAYLEVGQAKCKAGQVKHAKQTLTRVSLDIECAMNGELYSIGLYRDGYSGASGQCVFIIGEQQLHGNSYDGINYIHWVSDELELLKALLSWLAEYDPDIIIGWNVINFDMQLLQKRCDYHGLTFAIGRDGSKPYWRKNKNSEQLFLEIAGRVVLDGIDLLKTATYSFPSFSLDNVARALLGLNKKVADVDHRVQEITDNFHHNKPALAAYNLEDCRLVWLIFEKTQLLEFAMLRSQLTGLAIDRIGGSVAAFTNLYLPKLHREGYVAPNMGDGHSGLVSPGGFVMDSIPGLYSNILVLDFKSLYPSIIRTFNIDPMGLIEGLKAPEQAIEGFDGAYFSRDQHFLPDIIEGLWAERDKAKKNKNAALSQAIKIIMNSFYGILGSTGCRFFDPRLSGSITKRSHEVLKTTKAWLETKNYQVIYGDTDSIFVNAGKDKTAEQCQVIGKALAQYINEKWTATFKDKYQVTSQLEIEFETHFSQFFMPTIRGQEIGTKKRYAGLLEQDGQQEIVFKGLESVRTDWTELAKQFQRELYHRVFNHLPVKDYVIEIVDKTKAGQFDHLLVYRKRIRRKLDDYVKNVPPHVKAARLADEKNALLNKPLKYQKRGWIEYYLTTVGPQAKEYLSAPLDYQLYVDRQLATVADAILPFIGTSFSEIVDDQLNLFS